MPTSLKYSDLTMREKSAIDALRLLDGESRNREQNFLAIVSGYRARVAELEAEGAAMVSQLRTEQHSCDRYRRSLEEVRTYAKGTDNYLYNLTDEALKS